jgi:hypothetical protein
MIRVKEDEMILCRLHPKSKERLEQLDASYIKGLNFAHRVSAAPTVASKNWTQRRTRFIACFPTRM